MNNSDTPTRKQKKISKRGVRVSAIILLVVAILSLVTCIGAYAKRDWLEPVAAINAEIINDMKGAIKAATFIVIPSLSILLILSSRLIWRLSNKLDGDKDTN